MSGWFCLKDMVSQQESKQDKRFYLQNTNLVIWESGFQSSLGTSTKTVLHTYWKSFNTLFRDFVEKSSFYHILSKANYESITAFCFFFLLDRSNSTICFCFVFLMQAFWDSENLICLPLFKAASANDVNGMPWLCFEGSSSYDGINFSVGLLPCA